MPNDQLLDYICCKNDPSMWIVPPFGHEDQTRQTAGSVARPPNEPGFLLTRAIASTPRLPVSMVSPTFGHGSNHTARTSPSSHWYPQKTHRRRKVIEDRIMVPLPSLNSIRFLGVFYRKEKVSIISMKRNDSNSYKLVQVFDSVPFSSHLDSRTLLGPHCMFPFQSSIRLSRNVPRSLGGTKPTNIQTSITYVYK